MWTAELADWPVRVSIDSMEAPCWGGMEMLLVVLFLQKQLRRRCWLTSKRIEGLFLWRHNVKMKRNKMLLLQKKLNTNAVLMLPLLCIV